MVPTNVPITFGTNIEVTKENLSSQSTRKHGNHSSHSLPGNMVIIVHMQLTKHKNNNNICSQSQVLLLIECMLFI